MNQPVTRVTVRLHHQQTPAAVSGAIPAPKIVIVALLLLAVFFYIRAISTSGEHAPRVAEVDQTQVGSAANESATVSEPAVVDGGAQVLAGVGPTSDQPPLDRPATIPGGVEMNPDLVAALNSVMDPTDDTADSTPQVASGLREVPATQLDLIKRVFSPELLRN